MAKKEKLIITEENKEEVVDLLLVKIESLNTQINEYQTKIELFESQIEKLLLTAKTLNKVASVVDNLLSTNIVKNYGFSESQMFYIGTGSGRIYTKPINDKIVEMISRIKTLDWRGVQKINQHFMK